MPTAKAIEILTDAAAMGVEAIQFTGGGEPLVHPDHLKIMRHARRLGLRLALVTNGELLTEESIEFLSDEADWVRVSLDAATPGVYSAIRARDPRTFDRVSLNVADLADDSRGEVSLSFVVVKENRHQLQAAADLAAALGVGHIRFGAVSTTDPDYYGDDVDRIRHDLATLAVPDGLTVANLFSDGRFVLTPPADPECFLQRFATFVGADLNVYRCCVFAYNDRGLLGSVADKRFADLWQSVSFDDFDARGCSHCPFEAKNQAMKSAVNAIHREFV